LLNSEIVKVEKEILVTKKPQQDAVKKNEQPATNRIRVEINE
jgi:hypothetical protein